MDVREIKILNGFVIKEKRESFDIETARDMLINGGQRCYTSAERKDREAVLVSHRICCPHCGKELPAYEHVFSDHEESACSDAEIENWACGQLSIFGSPDELILNSPIRCRVIRCPACCTTIRKADGYDLLRIIKSGHSLIAEAAITKINSLVGLSYLGKRRISVRLPAVERLEFNFRSGRSFIKLIDSEGLLLAAADLSFNPDIFINGHLYNLLDSCGESGEVFRQCFSECYGLPLPFKPGELKPEKFILMTAFMGYPRSFYDALPVNRRTGTIDKSMRRLCRRLHRASDAPEIYAGSSLPMAKSIRKRVFENPSLLFYLPQLEKMSAIFSDVNEFRQFIGLDQIIFFMASMHLQPGIYEYFALVKELKGSKALYKSFSIDYMELKKRAVNYICLNNRAKLELRRSWANFEDDESFTDGFGTYESWMDEESEQTDSNSCPMFFESDRIPDCVIDGYRFEWLRTGMDYIRVSKALHNCLRTWACWDNGVVAVYRGSRPVAAIEIVPHEDIIVQARMENNVCIDEDIRLYRAFSDWARQFNLTLDEDFYDDDFDPDFD